MLLLYMWWASFHDNCNKNVLSITCGRVFLHGYILKQALVLLMFIRRRGKWFVTNEFPAQMASNAENVSIWWHHHVMTHPCHNFNRGLLNRLRYRFVTTSHRKCDVISYPCPRFSMSIIPGDKDSLRPYTCMYIILRGANIRNILILPQICHCLPTKGICNQQWEKKTIICVAQAKILFYKTARELSLWSKSISKKLDIAFHERT